MELEIGAESVLIGAKRGPGFHFLLLRESQMWWEQRAVIRDNFLHVDEAALQEKPIFRRKENIVRATNPRAPTSMG